MIEEKDIKNNLENKISCKIEANSRGFVTSVHVYEGARKTSITKPSQKPFMHILLYKNG